MKQAVTRAATYIISNGLNEGPYKWTLNSYDLTPGTVYERVCVCLKNKNGFLGGEL